MDGQSLDALRDRIHALSADAEVLLLRANHDAMKTHIRTALRDLKEALALLDYEQHTKAQGLLNDVVGGAIQSAALRLQRVEWALTNHGPDADTIE